MATDNERIDTLAEAVNKLAWAVTALALKGADEPRTNEGKEAFKHLAEAQELIRQIAPD